MKFIVATYGMIAIEIPARLQTIFAGKSWGLIRVADHASLAVERRQLRNPGGDRANCYRLRAATEPTADRSVGTQSTAHR
jgi:hypothetical protein